MEPVLIDDPVLLYKIEPSSAGHDSWGFRNESVPESSAVVAIGDSQTYGYSARSSESWPSWLQQLTGREVYNVGIGGYGPAQYFHLLATRATELGAELVVVGLYYGNDFVDAHTPVYSAGHWRDLRSPDEQNPPETDSSQAQAKPKQDAPARPGVVKRFRNWLRRHSMIFRVIEEGPVGHTINAWGDRQGASHDGACFVQSRPPFATSFTPEDRFSGMNLADSKVREGLDLGLEFFRRMAEYCRERHVDFLAVLIPTKESVFSDQIEASTGPRCRGIMERLIANEAALDERVKTFFQHNDIDYVDTLPPLHGAVDQERIYLRSVDSHPNKDGYRIIAKAILSHLSSQ